MGAGSRRVSPDAPPCFLSPSEVPRRRATAGSPVLPLTEAGLWPRGAAGARSLQDCVASVWGPLPGPSLLADASERSPRTPRLFDVPRGAVSRSAGLLHSLGPRVPVPGGGSSSTPAVGHSPVSALGRCRRSGAPLSSPAGQELAAHCAVLTERLDSQTGRLRHGGGVPRPFPAGRHGAGLPRPSDLRARLGGVCSPQPGVGPWLCCLPCPRGLGALAMDPCSHSGSSPLGKAPHVALGLLAVVWATSGSARGSHIRPQFSLLSVGRGPLRTHTPKEATGRVWATAAD